jgi:hypothetical protein
MGKNRKKYFLFNFLILIILIWLIFQIRKWHFTHNICCCCLSWSKPNCCEAGDARLAGGGCSKFPEFPSPIFPQMPFCVIGRWRCGGG